MKPCADLKAQWNVFAQVNEKARIKADLNYMETTCMTIAGVVYLYWSRVNGERLQC